MDPTGTAAGERRWVPQASSPLRARLGDSAGVELTLRAFGGKREDLDLDFAAVGRPQLSVAVLSRCASLQDGAALDEAWLWKLPVSERLHGLLALVGLTDARPLEVRVTCRCGEALEIDLQVGDLLSFGPAPPATWPISVSVGGGGTVRLRAPTGEDQLQWATLVVDETLEGAPAARAVLERLVVGNEGVRLADGWLPGLDRALAEADPLIDFRVATRCPSCGADLDAEIDLEESALARLGQVQRRLVHDVHQLALAYHWSEESIVALPAWRRARYLTFVGEQRG